MGNRKEKSKKIRESTHKIQHPIGIIPKRKKEIIKKVTWKTPQT